MDKPNVFVSSTSDLETERKALLNNLRPMYEPYGYEEDRARRDSPEVHCLRAIKRANVFVGVLGKNYGSRFSEADERSIVQWEFEMAAQDPEKEILTFVRSYPDGTQIDARQQAFIDQVTDFRKGVWCKYFGSSSELVGLVREALESWLVEFWRTMQSRQQQQFARLKPILIAIACAMVSAILIIAITPLQSLFTPVSIIAMSITIVCANLMSLALLYSHRGVEHVD